MLRHEGEQQQWQQEQPFFRLHKERLTSGNLEEHCSTVASELGKSVPSFFPVWPGNPEEMATSVGAAIGLEIPKPKRHIHLPWDIEPRREFFIVDERPRTKDVIVKGEQKIEEIDTPLVLASVRVYSEEPLRYTVKGYPTEDGLGTRLAEALEGQFIITQAELSGRSRVVRQRYQKAGGFAALAAVIGISGHFAAGVIKGTGGTAVTEPTAIERQLPSPLQLQKDYERELAKAERLYKEGLRDFKAANVQISSGDISDLRSQMSSPDSAVALNAVRIFRRSVLLGINTEGSVYIAGSGMSPGIYSEIILTGDSYLDKISKASLSSAVRNEARAAAAEIRDLRK